MEFLFKKKNYHISNFLKNSTFRLKSLIIIVILKKFPVKSVNSDVLKGFKDEERYKKKKKEREKEKTNENLKVYIKALITTLLILLKKIIR